LRTAPFATPVHAIVSSRFVADAIFTRTSGCAPDAALLSNYPAIVPGSPGMRVIAIADRRLRGWPGRCRCCSLPKAPPLHLRQRRCTNQISSDCASLTVVIAASSVDANVSIAQAADVVVLQPSPPSCVSDSDNIKVNDRLPLVHHSTTLNHLVVATLFPRSRYIFPGTLFLF
jgi:hypothetical protein